MIPAGDRQILISNFDFRRPQDSRSATRTRAIKQGALKQITLTSDGLTPTSRSVIIHMLRTTERNVADGPTVVRASAKQSALKQIVLTSGGLTPTLRPVFIHALWIQSAM